MKNQCLLRYSCTCFLHKGYEAYKANQTGVACWVLSYRNEDDVFPLEVVCEPAKWLIWLTMILYLFLA